MKIIVLGGGISTERHVSLVTAASVCRALRSLGHKAVLWISSSALRITREEWRISSKHRTACARMR